MLAATVQRSRGQDVVRILNVSSYGALIIGDDIPPITSTITLQIGKTSVEGRICWANGRYAGISFAKAIDRQKLARRVTSATTSAPSHSVAEWRRPGVRGDGLTRSEKLFIERLRREGRLPLPPFEC